MSAGVDETVFQFYYTSCERGLAGHRGYQFNAATPGAPAVLVRDVEPLLAYEPPDPMLRAQTAEELALCPVNLCYAPGPVTTIANIEYVGRDYSRRPGNFFAHALAVKAPDQDAAARLPGPLLPVELWRSPLWQHAESESTELPPFTDAARRGTLTAASVGGFLSAHPHAAELPRLATAALLAATEHGRSVLIVDRDSDAVAQWIAGICYLLPAPLARRISFATYLSRPSRSALNVLGTVPEAGADLGKDATENFELFDFAGGRISDLAPDPYLEWLCGLGLGAARETWNLAPILATGTESSLADWHPIGLAGAALGTRLARADLDTLFGWLARLTDRITGEPTEELRGALWTLGRGLLDQPLGEPHLPVLLRIARVSGNNDLYSVALQRWFEPALDLVARGDSRAPQPVVTGSEAHRARQSGLLRTRLEHAEVLQTLRLLAWASGSGLAVDEEFLTGFGSGNLANWVLDTDPQAQEGERKHLVESVEYWPPLRTALIGALAQAAPENPDAADRALAGPLRQVLTEERLAGTPGLLDSRQIGGALNRPDRKLDVLGSILRRRGRDLPEPELLARIWVGGWNLEQAAAAAQRLNPTGDVDPSLADWFARPLDPNGNRGQDTTWDTAQYLRLARRLHRAGVLAHLADLRLQDLELTLALDQNLDDAVDYLALSSLLSQTKTTRNPIRRRLVRERLLPKLARLELTAGQIDAVLNNLDYDQTDAYLNLLETRLAKSKSSWDHETIAGLWLAHGPAAQQYQPEIRAIVDQALRARGRRGAEGVAEVLESLGKQHLAVEVLNEYGKSRFSRSIQRRRPGTGMDGIDQ